MVSGSICACVCVLGFDLVFLEAKWLSFHYCWNFFCENSGSISVFC